MQLGADHPEYQSVALRRRSGCKNYKVVEVDADKLIHYSNLNRPDFVIAPVECWQPSEREAFFQFLAPPRPLEKPVEMPIISFNDECVVQYVRKWCFFKVAVRHRRIYIGYTNGRHRTRYLYYAGAKLIPVMCPDSDVSALKFYCGP